ncbi:hypothetical protein HYR54_07675 [Candidatus Acetothermia bacterium]|nr:hypothetical protein [Candidatus Acetothermia bacterium]
MVLEMRDWLAVISVVLNVFVLIIGFTLFWFKLGSKFEALRSDIVNGVKSVEVFMSSYGVLLGLLAKKRSFSTSEMQAINEPFRESSRDKIRELVNRIKPGNPITAEEVSQLKSYLDRVERGELLDEPEAKEFYRISQKVEKEPQYRTDVGAALLAGLAAFILGLAIGAALSKD